MTQTLLLGCAVSFSVIERLCHRWALKDRASMHGYALLYQFSAAMVLLGYLCSNRGERPPPATLWANCGWIIAAGIAWTLFAYFSFSADRFLQASSKAIISRLRIFWVWLLGIFVFAEVITINKVLGGMLLLSGVIILSRNKESINPRGAALEAAGSIFVSLALTFDKVLVQSLSPTFVTMLAFLNSSLLFLLLFPHCVRDARRVLRELRARLILPVTAGVLSYLSFVHCLQQGELSLVVPLYQSSSIITIIAGHFLFQELGNLRFKLSCGLLSVIGALLMVIR